MKKALQFNPTTDYYKQCELLFGEISNLKAQHSIQPTKKQKKTFEKFNPHKDYYKVYLELHYELQNLKESIKSQTETV